MDYLVVGSFVFFLLTIVSVLVVGMYQVVGVVFDYFFKDFVNRNLIFYRLDPKAKQFLAANVTFYQRLNESDKKMFERRVQKFMKLKEFEPRGVLGEITLEMKTLVAAAAVQITFGLPAIYFSHFDKIIIYPDDYYSTITRQYHKGEVNTRGVIVLSWKNMVRGYGDQGDGRNLALHEMAHALRITDSIMGDEYDFLDNGLFRKFIYLARIEMQKIADGEESFFRDYAAANDHEFFAVAVENFFERSDTFFEYHTELYQLLAGLLQQDPRRYGASN